MTKTYSRRKCFVCGKQHSANGLAQTNHMRKHVREGILLEVRAMDDAGHWSSAFTLPITKFKLWQEKYAKPKESNNANVREASDSEATE